MMIQSTLYFIAAALFVVAGAISTASDGISLKTALGVVIVEQLIAEDGLLQKYERIR